VLLQPYRAFGYYTSHVPLCIYKSSEDTLIASVVGKHAFYVFNSTKLNLVFMSRFIAEEITHLQASTTGLIYTSLKETNQIVAWNKMHRHATYENGHDPKNSIL
jgi:aspartyl/asparaginyl beta-hydroxylase (cupin superfamily)